MEKLSCGGSSPASSLFTRVNVFAVTVYPREFRRDGKQLFFCPAYDGGRTSAKLITRFEFVFLLV